MLRSRGVIHRVVRSTGRGGSLETAGVKLSFWSLLGLRPKVTRAGARNSPQIKENGGAHGPPPCGMVRLCGMRAAQEVCLSGPSGTPAPTEGGQDRRCSAGRRREGMPPYEVDIGRAAPHRAPPCAPRLAAPPRAVRRCAWLTTACRTARSGCPSRSAPWNTIPAAVPHPSDRTGYRLRTAPHR